MNFYYRKSLPAEETTEAPVKQRRISKKQRLQLALLLNGGEQQDEPVPVKKRRMSKKRKLQEALLLESPPVERDVNEPEDLRFSQYVRNAFAWLIDWLIGAPLIDYAIGRLIDWVIDWVITFCLDSSNLFIPNRNMSSFDSGLPAELPVVKIKRPYRKKKNNLAVFLATHQNDFIFPASGSPLGSWVFSSLFFCKSYW